MNEANIIDGKAFARTIREKVAQSVAVMKQEQGLRPGLAVILVGDDPASGIYVRNKHRACEEAGIQSFQLQTPDSISQDDLLEKIAELNADETVHGILVQLPLPAQIDEQAVIAAIAPEKDVDGFHVINSGKLFTGAGDAMVPCTPLGCLAMIKDRLGELNGKRALVVGRSNIVGKPMALLLLSENCTVSIAHSRTRDLAEEVGRADILVAAVGRPEMIKGDWIKPGACVIDVGINRLEPDQNGKSRLVGDVEFEAARKVAGAITPVPGGVGPMTIAMLLVNTVRCAASQAGLPAPDLP